MGICGNEIGVTSVLKPLDNPRWVTSLYSTNELAWVWLIVRVYIGWNWLDAGWHKVTSDDWMNGGSALAGFWARAISIPEQGRPPISYDWYREFLQFMLDNGWEVWFGPLIGVGELLVGFGPRLELLTVARQVGGVFGRAAGQRSIEPQGQDLGDAATFQRWGAQLDQVAEHSVLLGRGSGLGSATEESRHDGCAIGLAQPVAPSCLELRQRLADAVLDVSPLRQRIELSELLRLERHRHRPV